VSFAWCGVIVDEPQFKWKHNSFKPKKTPFIYECHIGMAQIEGKISTYREFKKYVLPRIKDLGYDYIQIMAIMEHPYYGSFGYQVSSFFAPSSRFGTANELKELIDAAHGMGIGVLLDIVHSHAVKNTAEGINEFDGTSYQFFHEGAKGDHPAWDTKLFNYGKNEVIHFLLSNVKYYLTEFRFDGFRFDGVTSMLYHDHGLGVAFTDYSKYFSLNTDTEAVTYLQLANALIKEISPDAISIAEDMSGMPGACLPIKDGGLGFDYRLNMGEPDMWIRLIKERRDEDWSMWQIWSELTGKRKGEKNIGYAESHDQALVGDKTIIFRLCDKNMYTDMNEGSSDPVIERGMALHKLIRMVTMTAGGDGYLNFMGNEFGHPEWIDFPREGNGWSYHYCRRQWNLADDHDLKYKYLLAFDKAMIRFLRSKRVLSFAPRSLYIDDKSKVLSYYRGGYVYAINFHPINSYEGYYLVVDKEGEYKVVLSSDRKEFGGYERVSETYVYRAVRHTDGLIKLRIYLPSRTGVILKKYKK
ncbi:MAG: alpha amylase C-terminal domain-containing protein, partial [Clostridia bacterium]|nr:alpha amylase C-terminal domain-containing protein [Clostridia bacterium]